MLACAPCLELRVEHKSAAEGSCRLLRLLQRQQRVACAHVRRRGERPKRRGGACVRKRITWATKAQQPLATAAEKCRVAGRPNERLRPCGASSSDVARGKQRAGARSGSC